MSSAGPSDHRTIGPSDHRTIGPSDHRTIGPRPILIALAYTAVAVVMTWPLAANLGTSIAADLGDPVFNAWVLLWTSGQVTAFLGGDLSALGRYWHGNIFHPETYTLAYSEHLTPQMLQALPVLALTDNVLVAYNLLFLSTFVLCGLGTYLFVRDVTGHPLAAFVAGLAFAWAPYRLAQVSHLQVLSTCWMPFALVGFRRFFATGRVRPLAGGTAAVVLQNLSCGYYLLYFPPFLAAYGVYEMVKRRLLLRWRVWAQLGAAALAVAVLTWPFVAPYLALRSGGEIGVRSDAEIRSFSADVRSLANAAPSLRLWSGRMNSFPHAEGEGFPGLTIVALAAIAVVAAGWRGVRSITRRSMPPFARAITLASAVVLGVSGTVAAWILVASGLTLSIGDASFFYYDPAPAVMLAAASATALFLTLAVTRGERDPAAGPELFFACACVAATLLAFGPLIMSGGRPMMAGPFAFLQAWVPGFDAGRVPARFLMLVALFLAVLAGLGAARLARAVPRRVAGPALGAVAALLLAESWVAPMNLDVPVGVPPGLVAPTELTPALTPLHRVVRDLPDPVVLIEFPFGEPAHDLYAMFYAGYHRRALVNGYSGYFPHSFTRRVGRLWDPTDDPERAAGWLADTAATHALVHEAFFADDRGPAVSAWLVSLGARPVTSDGPDRLFQLK